jgi:hypothetical protein
MPNFETGLLPCREDQVTMNATPDPACREYCLYDFPRCADCPYAVRAEPICNSVEDPMKSAVVRGWIHGISRISK